MSLSESRRLPVAALLRSTGLVIVGIIISTITGFAREAIVAWQYGLSRQADIYVMAFQVPQFLFVALSVTLSAALIPVYAELRLSQGEDVAWAFLRTFSALLSLGLAVISLLAVVAAPWYLPILAPGFNSSDVDQTFLISAIMMPAVIVTGLSYTVSAVLNVYRRFAWPSLAAAAYNIGFVIAAVALHDRLGLPALGYAVVLGSLLHMGVQAPQLLGLMRKDIRSAWLSPPIRRGLRRLAAVALPIAAGYALHHISIVVDRAMASDLSAGVVAGLNYADRLAQVVGQLLGIAVSTVFFPTLAEQASQGDMPGLRRTLQLSLRLVALAGLPLTAGIVILRQPLVGLLFGHGRFDVSGVGLTSTLLAWMVVGMLADALNQPLWRTTYAMQSGRTALWVNGSKTVLRVGMNLALVPLLAAQGLAISYAIGFMAQLLILSWVVTRQVGPFLEYSLLDLLWRLLAATAIMGVVCGLLLQALAVRFDTQATLPQVIALVACSLSGAIVYALAVWSLAVPEARSAQRWLWRRAHHFRGLHEETVT